MDEKDLGRVTRVLLADGWHDVVGGVWFDVLALPAGRDIAVLGWAEAERHPSLVLFGTSAPIEHVLAFRFPTIDWDDPEPDDEPAGPPTIADVARGVTNAINTLMERAGHATQTP